MSEPAFSAGVKPGGLTSETEIKILLCYLLAKAELPLSQAQLETALAGQELVNCFELANALHALVVQGHLLQEGTLYTITKSGTDLADMLSVDLPLTVKETALSAMLRLQAYSKKARHNQAEIKEAENGYLLICRIVDEEQKPPIFTMTFHFPDFPTAELAKKCFVENGDNIYLLVAAGLTGQKELAKDYLEK